MSEPLSSIFDSAVAFDPDGDFEAFCRGVPAKWVVYLLADQDQKPLQLLCVKNLRASLKRRLSGEELIEPSRRINYRQVVRQVFWHRVDSALEADWLYLEAARRIFPESYQGMVGFRPAWFIHVNPDAPFPRYIKTTDLSRDQGLYIGPVEDKHAAGRLIELIEDAFDLCRYYNILTLAPHGSACAYKQMHKCPAPCDGSIPMVQYRWMIQWSAAVLIDPEGLMREQTARMQQAAGELRFELAGKIKAFIDQLGQLGKGAFRHARLLRDFVFLSLQRGPRGGTAKLLLITPGQIREIAGLIAEPAGDAELVAMAREAAGQRSGVGVDAEAAERIGVATHHLFSPKQLPGAFLRLGEVDSKSLAKAWRELQKQKDEEPEDQEGIVKQLQAM